MGTVSKKDVAEAVNFLILASNYTKLINEITRIIERFDTHPIGFRGKLDCLNALIDVGLADRAAFERLVRLMEARRKLIPDSKRADYQRDMMRERRARMAKALELHELTHHLTLTGAARRMKEREIQTRWRKARDQFIGERGELSWGERNDAAGEFWAKIDAQLDASLALEQQKRRA